MKSLCFKLASLIPSRHFKSCNKESLSQQDQLEHAAAYIKELRERIEELKGRKEEALIMDESRSGKYSRSIDDGGLRLPMVELRDMGSSIEVNVISGLNKNFMSYQVIRILQEEGADVVSASFNTVGDKIFHTFHAQVKITRVGVETSRVCQRLEEMIC